MFQPGEVPVVAARAMVGAFSSSRFGAVATQAVLQEGVGSMSAHRLAQSKRQFVVVTNRRVFFLTQTFLGGPGKTVLGAVGREVVALAEVKMGFVSLLRIAFGAQGDGVALTFPRAEKKNAEALAQALQQAPVV